MRNKIITLCINHHHHHLSFMQLGHLLTRSGLTCPEASTKVCHDSFCRSGSSVSLSWVVYYEALCINYVIIICVNNNAVINNNYGRPQNLILLL
jgi:hypothetical protein